MEVPKNAVGIISKKCSNAICELGCVGSVNRQFSYHKPMLLRRYDIVLCNVNSPKYNAFECLAQRT